MQSTEHGAFAGFGRHLAEDLLFYIAIYPGIPGYMICEDEKLFEVFNNALIAMMEAFTSSEFSTYCGIPADAQQPFKFRDKANREYMKCWLAIFKRTKVLVKRDLYNYYAKLGLLDPEHTMGKQYQLNSVHGNSQYSFLKGNHIQMRNTYY